MNWLGLEKLSKMLKVCLQVTFVIGLFITLFLGIILKQYFDWYIIYNSQYYWACVILVTPCGLSSLNILWQLIRLLETIHHKNPFVNKNVIGLKRIAVSSFVISIMFFILMFAQATVLTFAISYIFLIAGFCFIVLAGLFQKAVEYKDENDMTI